MSGVLPATELQARLQRAVGDAYVVERELGGGGMSRLYLATEASLNRKVVLKLLAPELTGDVSLARFKREFELTALLQHPNILPVLATGSRDGMLWYVTPYIAGESLRHRLQRETKLPIDDVARILHEVSDALAYAHERGVVHRDIKPENILLSNGHAVLADFGIAAALAPGATPHPDAPAEASRLTQVGTAMGTPGYMSPEQAAGEWNLDARSDIYALGCVGYEMLGGRPPFVGTTPRHVIAAHLSEQPKPIEEHRADTPPGVAEAIMRALAKEPADRWQNAAEFRDALGMSFTGARASYARPARRGRRRLVAGLALAAVAAAAVGTWLVRRGGSQGLDQNLVAVAPFEVLDPSLSVWREGLVDVLSANLDGMGPLRTVPPTTVIRRWRGRPDRETATLLGQRTGAKLVLYGRVVPGGRDSARVTATLFDVSSGRPVAELQAADASARVDRIADSLTVRVLRELNQQRAIGSVRRASLGSSSIVALKAYLQGEQHFRRSDFDSAAVYYERAVQADSMFAPAIRKLGQSLAWNTLGASGENAGRAHPLSLRAGQLNRGLAPRESLLVLADSLNAAVNLNAGKMRVRPMAARLLAVLDSAAHRFPDDPEIWYRLGDARYHMLAMAQAPETYQRAREAFDRSIALDSAFGPSYIHPVEIALRQQDLEGARRYMAAYLALEPHDTYARSFRLMQKLTDPRTAPAVTPESVWAGGPSVVGNVISGMLWVFDDQESAIRLFRSVKDGGGNQLLATQGKYGLAFALAMRGKVREATEMTKDTMLFQLRPELALVGAFSADSMDRKGREFLAADSAMQITSAYVFRTWAERGDTVPLLQALRLSDRWPATASGAKLWPVVTRGYLALARRDTAAALEAFAAVPDTFCMGYPACHIARYTKAQLLLAKGRNPEAAKTLDVDFAYTGPLGVLWQLAKGQANERLGDREKAIDAYTFVANALRRADPEMQPVAAEARRGLQRLAPDRRTGGG